MKTKAPRGVSRIGVSLEPALLGQLDLWLDQKGYTNRSQGIRDIVRARFIQEDWERGDRATVATVNLVYDHHKRELMERLAALQHDHLDNIVSSLHVHLDAQHCLEVLVLRGKGRELKALGERLIATKGVLHGTISFAGTNTPAGKGKRGAAPGHSHDSGEPHTHD
jgi:CopG family nickel-responsive transcriptional regulator